MRIALAQINPVVGDLKGNINKIVQFVRKAQKFKADIITFPELAVCGYPPEDLLLKKEFVKDNLKALNLLRKDSFRIVVIVGFADKDKKGNLYNAAAIINNGRVKAVYHKTNLFSSGTFDEKKYFNPGKKFSLFSLNKVVFGINIGEEFREQGKTAKEQVNKKVQLIINISASPYYIGNVKLKEKKLVPWIKKAKTYFCYNNQVGGQDELVFDGGSGVFNPNGEKIATAKRFKEDLIIADLAIKRSKSNVELKKSIKLNTLKSSEKPVLPKRKIEKLNKIGEIYEALVLGTHDYIRKNGFQKAVIGLSGGVDSALTAAIARDAIGKENIIGISMPSCFSSPETQADAGILAKNLGIKLLVIPIDKIWKVYLRVLEKEFRGLKENVTEENLQARIRANILMAFSNKFKWMVLSTGNKSESSVGYCTLYGDMAGGFAVIKDIPKMLVYELSRFVNKKGEKLLISESILSRAPSAELKINQKDQDVLPPYSILDKIIKGYEEEDKNSKEIAANKIRAITVRKVIRMIDRSEYKRRQSSPGIKITAKVLSKDRKFPITNSYKG
ncbi:NAD+ synthase [bacterium]|nr:NAD+ synthase [bacterium]